MFFTISKILSFLFSPLSWVALLILLAWVWKKRRKIVFILASVVFFLFSNSFIVDEVLRAWEYPLCQEEALESVYDAGIILGGGMATIDANNERVTFRHNPDRLMQGIQLYKKGRIRKIILSGGSGSLLYPDMLEAPILKNFLVEIGIPEQDVLIDSLSNNTHENAVNTVDLLEAKYPGGKYLLITSSTHMRRSLACFKKEGLEPDAYATGKMVGSRRYQPAYLLIPNLNAIAKWEKMLHEMIGYVIYDWMGYI